MPVLHHWWVDSNIIYMYIKRATCFHALKYHKLFCVCSGAWKPAGQHRPQHPHVKRGAGGVCAVEERARADRQGKSGTPQKRQGSVEAGVGRGQNWEHVRLLSTQPSHGTSFSCSWVIFRWLPLSLILENSIPGNVDQTFESSAPLHSFTFTLIFPMATWWLKESRVLFDQLGIGNLLL